jgi:hypothetical protein
MTTKVTTFSGRCTGRELRAQALRRAHQAQYLAEWRALNPEPEQYIERQMWGMLLAMCFLLGIAFLLHAYDAPRPSPTPVVATVPSQFAWYESDHLQ